MISTPHPSSTPRDTRTVSHLNPVPGRIGTMAEAATGSETLVTEAKPELRSKLDSIPYLAWRAQPGGFAEYLNKRWLDFTGLTLQQAVGWQWQAAVHPDDLLGLNGARRKILASGTSGKIEARMRRFDGVYRWFMFRIEPYHDTTGAIVAWYGTNTDIDDRESFRDVQLELTHAKRARIHRTAHGVHRAPSQAAHRGDGRQGRAAMTPA